MYAIVIPINQGRGTHDKLHFILALLIKQMVIAVLTTGEAGWTRRLRIHSTNRLHHPATETDSSRDSRLATDLGM